MKTPLRYVECPRDSWQGFHGQIPTLAKRQYLKALLKAGFRHLDLGSFVSPKAVPQLADTEAVLASLERPEDADFLCIIANDKGLERALAVPQVSSVGYPLSVNETFQKRNTNRGLDDAWPLVKAMSKEASRRRLGFVVYLSMAFGNPYGEPWQPLDAARAVARLREMGVSRIALADTVGTATPQTIHAVLAATPEPQGLGLHLHAKPDGWQAPLEHALDSGLTWFEGALAGVGGCPFAGDALVGNLPSEHVLPWLAARGYDAGVSPVRLSELAQEAARLQEAYA
jgi:hydroxymethylglutaryl-CoA lyase